MKFAYVGTLIILFCKDYSVGLCVCGSFAYCAERQVFFFLVFFSCSDFSRMLANFSSFQFRMAAVRCKLCLISLYG